MTTFICIVGIVLYIILGLITAALVDRVSGTGSSSRWDEDDRKFRTTLCFIAWPIIVVFTILIGLIVGIFWFLTNIGNILIKAIDKINSLISRIID